jgi:hypothetical protein
MAIQKPSQASAAERVQNSFKQLSLAATNLSTATDELGRAISVWDAALKKLNLGVSAWVELSSGRDGFHWWDRSVGYAKLKDRWGIALREREGIDPAEENDEVETWPFSEAPRWMRIEGVGKLPDLLDALLKQAEDTTKKIRGRIGEACDLAKAIEAGEIHGTSPDQTPGLEASLAAEVAKNLLNYTASENASQVPSAANLAAVDAFSATGAVSAAVAADAFNVSVGSTTINAEAFDRIKTDVGATAAIQTEFGRYLGSTKRGKR